MPYPHHGTIGHYGCGKHRFSPRLYAQYGAAQPLYVLNRTHQGHDIRSKQIHQQPHEGHHCHAQPHRYVSEAPDQPRTRRSIALPGEGGGSVAYAIARHVAQALGRDSKSIGRNGHDSKRSHNHGHGYLGTAYHCMLHSNGSRYGQGLLQHLRIGPVTAMEPLQLHFRLTAIEVVEHQSGGDSFGQDCAQRCAKHTQSGSRHGEADRSQLQLTCGEYEDKVEQTVHDAHQHIEHAGYLHVANTAEHASSQIIDRQQWQCRHKHHEVKRCLRAYFRRSAQPVRQRQRYGHAYGCYDQTEQQTCAYALTQHITRAFIVRRSHLVGHLHRKSGGHSRAYAPEQP